MELWVGPAIVAAVVSGLINALGWFVTFRQSRRLEQLRRDEKVHDFQVALRAEIASDLLGLSVFDHAEVLSTVSRQYVEDKGFSVLVPHMASNTIFEAVIGEIHILPGEVIDPVVDYQRLRQTIERFATDLRSQSFAALPSERQLVMFGDYLKMMQRLQVLAERAVTALDNSLLISSRGAGPSNPPLEQASAAAASASGQEGAP